MKCDFIDIFRVCVDGIDISPERVDKIAFHRHINISPTKIENLRLKPYASSVGKDASMPRQLNIRSDEAYRIAKSLAQRYRTTTTRIIEQALTELERKAPAVETVGLTPEQKASYDSLKALAREAGKHKLPGATSDHSDLYDEHGLPR